MLSGLCFHERVIRSEFFVAVSPVPRGPHMRLPARHVAHKQTMDGIYAPRRAGEVAGGVLVRGAGADRMPAPDRVNAWCARSVGNESQRSPCPTRSPARACDRRAT